MSELRPLEPTLSAGLFAPLGRELDVMLRSLEPEDWARPTVCSKWSVRDIAAHLLDTACRRISVERDGHQLPPSHPIADYESLVAYLDELNADWVHASRRLSPRVLVDLIAAVECDLAEVLTALDPFASARFPVSWAGEDGSKVWFDVARELTERWLHQQQIRLAVGAEPLTDPTLSQPVFDTFLRALPHRYLEIDAAESARVAIEIVGARDYAYTLVREGGGWMLRAGRGGESTASLRVPEEVAWLSLTKGIEPGVARDRSEAVGREELWRPFFDTVAVMA